MPQTKVVSSSASQRYSSNVDTSSGGRGEVGLVLATGRRRGRGEVKRGGGGGESGESSGDEEEYEEGDFSEYHL